MRFRLTNTDAVYAAYVRLRLWIDIEYADGSHATKIDLLSADAVAPDSAAGHPQLWADLWVVLDPGQTFAIPAPLFLPMNNNTEAYYSLEYAAIGPGAGKIDFQRSAIPTEKDSAWQIMNNPAVALAMARGSGYIHRTFAAEGVVADEHPARGYQRFFLTNTAGAPNWTCLHVRVWAHLSGA